MELGQMDGMGWDGMEEVEEENRDQVNCDEEDGGGDTVNFWRGE